MAIFSQPEVIAAIVGAVVGGLIGILGSLATLIVTNMIKNHGRLIIYTNSTKIRFTKQETGVTKEVENFSDAQNISIDVAVDFYNPSDTPRTLAKFELEISHKKNKKVFETKETHVLEGRFPVLVAIDPITVFPRTTEKVRSHAYLQPADISMFKTASVYLLATYPDKKKFRERVLVVTL